MEQAIFRRFCELAHEKAGIALKPGKEELVAARVAKRLRALNVETVGEYLKYLERDESGEELAQFLDAISTNFTSFFREADHLTLFGDLLKRWGEAGQRRFRFWSAACSSGEEPYSMAITALDVLKPWEADFRILATDISTRVLAECEAAVYPAAKVDPVPARFRARYFSRRDGPEGSEGPVFEVKPEVKARAVFRRLNLSTPPFPMHGPFDVVFCRNVLIYFDTPVRQGLIAEIERLLRPGGFLFIGHTETLSGVASGFKMVRPSVFRLPEGPESKA